MDILSFLEEELKNLPPEYIIYVETTPEKTLDVSNAIVKYFSGKNDEGIIVSANRPYVTLLNNYKKYNIDTSKMFIIDCISKSLNADNVTPNVSFVENLSVCPP